MAGIPYLIVRARSAFRVVMQSGRELLGEIDVACGECGQHGEPGNQRTGDHRPCRKIAGAVRHHHQEEAGQRSGKRTILCSESGQS